MYFHRRAGHRTGLICLWERITFFGSGCRRL